MQTGTYYELDTSKAQAAVYVSAGGAMASLAISDGTKGGAARRRKSSYAFGVA